MADRLPTHVVEVTNGLAQPSFVLLSLGQELSEITIGRRGAWRIDGQRVRDEHAKLYFDGRSFFVQSSAHDDLVLVDGVKVPPAWAPFKAPCVMDIGGVTLHFRALMPDDPRALVPMPANPLSPVAIVNPHAQSESKAARGSSPSGALSTPPPSSRSGGLSSHRSSSKSVPPPSVRSAPPPSVKSAPPPSVRQSSPSSSRSAPLHTPAPSSRPSSPSSPPSRPSRPSENHFLGLDDEATRIAPVEHTEVAKRVTQLRAALLVGGGEGAAATASGATPTPPEVSKVVVPADRSSSALGQGAQERGGRPGGTAVLPVANLPGYSPALMQPGPGPDGVMPPGAMPSPSFGPEPAPRGLSGVQRALLIIGPIAVMTALYAFLGPMSRGVTDREALATSSTTSSAASPGATPGSGAAPTGTLWPLGVPWPPGVACPPPNWPPDAPLPCVQSNGASGLAAAAQPGDAPGAETPSASSPPAPGTGGTAAPAAAATAATTRDGGAPTPGGHKTLERRAVDAVAAGNYAEAAYLYEQLSQNEPTRQTYSEALRILRARLDASAR